MTLFFSNVIPPQESLANVINEDTQGGVLADISAVSTIGLTFRSWALHRPTKQAVIGRTADASKKPFSHLIILHRINRPQQSKAAASLQSCRYLRQVSTLMLYVLRKEFAISVTRMRSKTWSENQFSARRKRPAYCHRNV